VQFVKLQGLPLYERRQLYEHSFAFFMTSMRLGMSNRLNMSHLNSDVIWFYTLRSYSLD